MDEKKSKNPFINLARESGKILPNNNSKIATKQQTKFTSQVNVNKPTRRSSRGR